MLFLTSWKPFFFFVVPVTVFAQLMIHTYTETVYSKLEDCDSMLQKYSKRASFFKDLVMIAAIVMGLYSHSKTLVSRHIAHENSEQL